MASKPTPSVFRIIQVDYQATFGAAFAVAPVLVFLMALIFVYGFDLRAFFSNKVIIVAILACCVILIPWGSLILYWRVKNLRSIFNDGIEVPGVITYVWKTSRRTCEVGSVYTIEGKEYTSSVTAGLIQTQFLYPQKNVMMVVDPDIPEYGLIKELYV